MSRSIPALIAAGVFLAPIASLPQPVEASESSTRSTEDCITEVLSPDQVEAGEISTILCYPSHDASLVAMGRAVDPYGSPAELMAAASSVTLAIHYDGFNGAGSTLTAYGPACNGDGIVLGGTSWDNRISSTQRVACGSAKHWDGYAFDGDNEVINSGSTTNLTYMNNRASSVTYG